MPVAKKTVKGLARGDLQLRGASVGRRKPRVPTLSALTGFAFTNTYKGVVTGDNGNRIFDQGAIQPTCGFIGIGSRYALGSYAGALFVTNANDAHLRWNISTFGASNPYAVTACYIAIDGGTGSPVIFHVDSGEGTGRFNLSVNMSTGILTLDVLGTSVDSTFAVDLGTDTYSDPGVEFRLDIMVDYSCTTYPGQWVADWMIDGIAQPQLRSAAGKSATNVFYVGISDPSGGKTMTVRYDDWVLSHVPDDYPLGSHSIKRLLPDWEFDALSFTGPESTWQIFENNGANINPFWYGAINYILLPAPASSTQAGIVQAVAGNYYMQIPMTSYTLGAGEVVSGGRMLFYGWAENTNPANIEIRLWNGVEEVVLHALADPHFNNSTVDLATVCRMIPLQYIDTQAKIDNLAIRFGWSTDASPKIGCAGVGIELSVYTPSAPSFQALQSASMPTSGGST